MIKFELSRRSENLIRKMAFGIRAIIAIKMSFTVNIRMKLMKALVLNHVH